MNHNLKDKITSIMYGDDQTGSGFWRTVLRTVSIFYAAGVRLRGRMYRLRFKPVRKLPCFVISVGNLTVGGTGKSPMVVYLANMLRELGYEVAVLSRGYLGAAEKRGGMVSDGHCTLMGPDEAGDEPYMLARTLLSRGVPVLVGQDRIRSGLLAVGHFRPHVILMDDGFQHRRLHRDLDVVLLDGMRPLGNGYLFPRGTLREPAGALKRADLLVMTRSDRASSNVRERVVRPQQLESNPNLFRSRHQPYVFATEANGSLHTSNGADVVDCEAANKAVCHGRRVFGFSGIARNQDFRQTLADLGFDVGGFKAFADHHRYTVEDFQQLQREATQHQCDTFVTTEKDYCRIAGHFNLTSGLIVIGVRIDFGKQADTFRKAIQDRLPPLNE
jgi:tetraacyldisaccharide 4'-kinase